MNCHAFKTTATSSERSEHLAVCGLCALEEKQQQAVWELTGQWQEVSPTPDFKKRFMSKVEAKPHAYWRQWFAWDWREIFIPASALAAMLIVVVSFLVWTPYQQGVVPSNQNHLVELASAVDLLENKELLTDIDLFSDLDVLMAIDPFELKSS